MIASYDGFQDAHHAAKPVLPNRSGVMQQPFGYEPNSGDPKASSEVEKARREEEGCPTTASQAPGCH